MKPIDKLLDCQHVKRWSMIATSANSNVASHSFNVAMIAMAIRKKMFNTAHYTEQDVCYYALIHDVDEAETGDMPTPTKMAIRARGSSRTLYSKRNVWPPSRLRSSKKSSRWRT